jgi:hypothetical protein
MLTRGEIDGFKTFKDFKVDLAPFLAIVEANSSGKGRIVQKGFATPQRRAVLCRSHCHTEHTQ